MLNLKDMVVKGYFSQPEIFKIIFSFLGQKIAFKNIYHILEDFSKFDWRPFKSTVSRIMLDLYFPINFLGITQIYECLQLHDERSTYTSFYLSPRRFQPSNVITKHLNPPLVRVQFGEYFQSDLAVSGVGYYPILLIIWHFCHKN